MSNEQMRHRFHFASAMSRIGNGASCEDVIAALGQPDDVRTLSDGDAGLLADTIEMWCYGVDAHLGFPTEGHIYINKMNLVHHYRPQPLPAVDLPALFDERELQRVLRLLDLSPNPNSAYNPRLLIQIVNQLQPLGKEKLLLAVSEYLRVAPYYGYKHARRGLFLVLRLLFDLPEKCNIYPDVEIGLSHPIPPDNRNLIPQFPLTVLGDIPLLLVHGYSVRGWVQPVEEHVAYYAANCSLRQSPLSPTNRPFTLFDEIMHASFSNWFQDDVRLGGAVTVQLLRIVDSVYHPIHPKSFFDLQLHELLPWLARYDQECQSIGLHWDPSLNDYAIRTQP